MSNTFVSSADDDQNMIHMPKKTCYNLFLAHQFFTSNVILQTCKLLRILFHLLHYISLSDIAYKHKYSKLLKKSFYQFLSTL